MCAYAPPTSTTERYWLPSFVPSARSLSNMLMILGSSSLRCALDQTALSAKNRSHLVRVMY